MFIVRQFSYFFFEFFYCCDHIMPYFSPYSTVMTNDDIILYFSTNGVEDMHG